MAAPERLPVGIQELSSDVSTANVVRSSEATLKSPYIIRAHHAMFTGHFLLAVLNPVGLKDFITRGAENFATNAERGIEYGHDVMGDNPREYTPDYIKQVQEYMYTFDQLQDQDPVHLTGTRDGICQACVIGNHCLEDNDDLKYMQLFIRAARSQGWKKGKDYLVVRGEDNKITRVETTKGILVDVIRGD